MTSAPLLVAAALGVALLAATRGAAAAPPPAAPQSVLEALGRARYVESKTSIVDARIVFAESGLESGQISALAWVRGEQSKGRRVFSTVTVLDELASGGAAPLYSFPADKVPSYLTKFLELPPAPG